MKKVFRRLAVTAALAIPNVGETGGANSDVSYNPYQEAPHTPQERCQAEIAEYLGASLMLAVNKDIQLAEAANKPTHEENEQKIEPTEAVSLDSFPTIEEYIDEHVEFIQSVELPESGIDYEIYSDESWTMNPASTDRMYRRALSFRDPENELRNLDYQCTERSIFDRDELDDTSYDLIIFGDGDLCLGPDEIVPRGLTPDLCIETGRYRRSSNRILIAPRGQTEREVEINASSFLAHEGGGHGHTDELGNDSKFAEYREFAAYGLQMAASDYLHHTTVLPLELEKID